MHKEHLLQLADWLAAGAPHEHVEFDMTGFLQPSFKAWNTPATNENICGTRCCIAGATVQFFCPGVFRHTCWNDVNYYQQAMNALELGVAQAWELFYAPHYPLEIITPQWAAKVIYHLVKTGEVDWRRFASEEAFHGR